MGITRRSSKKVYIGNVPVGGGSPVSVQSMTNTDTRDLAGTINQINSLAEAGCQIIRVAVPDSEAAGNLKEIVRQSPIPVVADIHFDHRLALEAVQAGVDGLRLNPGTISDPAKVRVVVSAAKKAGIPIRVGANSGSVNRKYLQKYGGPTAEAMVDSALEHIRILEQEGFDDIIISLKATDVFRTLEAYRLIARKVEYPFHIGITEAGGGYAGIVKSSVGLGLLLYEGLGDTIRVSLTGDPVQEVKAGIEILRSLGLYREGVEIISCPTCGRCEIDLVSLAEKVRELTEVVKKPLKVAVMGCPVNGPGEAREADLGIAGGRKMGLIFRKGQVVDKVPEEQLFPRFKQELDKILSE